MYIGYVELCTQTLLQQDGIRVAQKSPATKIVHFTRIKSYIKICQRDYSFFVELKYQTMHYNIIAQY